MGLFKKRAAAKEAAREAGQAATNPNYVPPEYRHEFAALNIELQDLANWIYSASDPRNEGEIARVLPPTIDAGVRWTSLSEKGYFMPLSTSISEAFAHITFGLMHEEEQAQIMDGLLMIRSAMDKAAEDSGVRGSGSKSPAPPIDRSLYGQGWTEPLFGEMTEGLFVVDELFSGLQLIVGKEHGGFPWSDITSVSMRPRSELAPEVLSFHDENVFSRSKDPNVFIGELADKAMFVIAPVGDNGWQQWLAAFERAGLLEAPSSDGVD